MNIDTVSALFEELNKIAVQLSGSNLPDSTVAAKRGNDDQFSRAQRRAKGRALYEQKRRDDRRSATEWMAARGKKERAANKGWAGAPSRPVGIMAAPAATPSRFGASVTRAGRSIAGRTKAPGVWEEAQRAAVGPKKSRSITGLLYSPGSTPRQRLMKDRKVQRISRLLDTSTNERNIKTIRANEKKREGTAPKRLRSPEALDAVLSRTPRGKATVDALKSSPSPSSFTVRSGMSRTQILKGLRTSSGNDKMTWGEAKKQFGRKAMLAGSTFGMQDGKFGLGKTDIKVRNEGRKAYTALKQRRAAAAAALRTPRPQPTQEVRGAQNVPRPTPPGERPGPLARMMNRGGYGGTGTPTLGDREAQPARTPAFYAPSIRSAPSGPSPALAPVGGAPGVQPPRLAAPALPGGNTFGVRGARPGAAPAPVLGTGATPKMVSPLKGGGLKMPKRPPKKNPISPPLKAGDSA